jgi:3-methyl-2-oxobutanoate hydroxymethyltransferase
VPVTVEDILLFTKAVTRSTKRSLIVADMPFGSYESGPQQAFETAVRFMKEGGAHAVKLEGGVRVRPADPAAHDAGIPVMAHVGFTPQSEHALGGYRVQGRGAGRRAAARRRPRRPGRRCVRRRPGDGAGEIAAQVTKELSIPTIVHRRRRARAAGYARCCVWMPGHGRD